MTLSPEQTPDATELWVKPDRLLPDEGSPWARSVAPSQPPAEPAQLASNDFPDDFRQLPAFRGTLRVRGWCALATRFLRRKPVAPEIAPEPEIPPVLSPPLAGAFLRSVTVDGQDADHMALTGLPLFLGTCEGPDGRQYAGVCISSVPGGRIIIDAASTQYLDDLITELATALAELQAAGGAR